MTTIKIGWIEGKKALFEKKSGKKFAGSEKSCTFATALREVLLAVQGNAEIAQLVEHDLAKVGVAGPSPVFRSHSGNMTNKKNIF